MAPSVVTGDLDQAKLLLFEKNFYRILEQENSKLASSPAVKYMGIEGISHINRVKGDELVDVTNSGRNPEKQFVTLYNDNRRSITKRFTLSYLVDKFDAIKLICDPTSVVYENLSQSKARTLDRCVADAASANVITGDPQTAGVSISAEDDGVQTITPAAFNYSNVISPAITMFENNNIPTDGVTLAISAAEKQGLRDDEKYMNSLYSSNNTVEKGDIQNASGFHIATFQGTVQGGAEAAHPILKEEEGKRTNLILAKGAIAFAYQVLTLDCSKADKYVNSYQITIDLAVKAVRVQGERVILVKTNI